ncbi:YvrJ family protein [Bacillus cereus]|jgi:hypothetical protein|uniref:YvrJ family protein n=2 Tax=Bacillus cereus group TaxID=86661 RepID=UPI0002E3379D|nr:YvrJ family protein [Bacillus cereus]MCU4733622.1 YvrJ family protein [Bacillus cereus]MCU5149240.1 YvrJ family protein [Bacillus cereus]MCU5496246.1 YvrJ family protein [Bacillus cereus]MCU5639325.1 YvrJ family protein [Bacillus cereus]MCU5702270.1 YvrJ family protein [Bacillus cereus]
MDATELKLIMMVIGNFGFPVALTIYLLIRFERKIENLTDVINKLKDVIWAKK